VTVVGPDEMPAHYAALSLVDHQMIDRSGRPCGNVDDLEFEMDDDGVFHLTAILAGPGMLATRLGWGRLGAWLRLSAGDAGMFRVPFWRVSGIDSRVRLAADAEELATWHRERWALDHVIGHLPGNDADPGERG
jgi:hypothetical protein